MKNASRRIAIVALSVVLGVAFLWAVGALYFDGPSKAVALSQLVLVPGSLCFLGTWRRRLGIFGLWFAIVLGWWLSLRP